MHFSQASKRVLFILSFLIFSFSLAQYTNAQTSQWFNWNSMAPDMLEERNIQSLPTAETEEVVETTEGEPAIETDEVIEGEATHTVDEIEEGVGVDDTTLESDAAPVLEVEITGERNSGEDTSESEQTTGACQEATTPEEDGVVDEDNWKCQEAALQEVQSTTMNTLAEPVSLSATLDSLNSQNFPFIYLNTRVLYDDIPVSDLPASAFQCTENNTPQILTVTPPQTGGNVRLADVVFLIDASGSMGGEISDVRNNIVTFASSLAASDVDFRLGLVQFGQSTNGGNPMVFGGGALTGDVTLFKSYVDQLRASGGYEPGFAAMRTAATSFTFRPGAQKIFLIVTDEDSDDRDKAGTISLMQANGIVVHAAAHCASGQSGNDYCNDTSVRAATGGALFPVAGPYSEVLDTIVTQTASTYVIRYKSTNPDFDGTERLVECTITHEDEQTIIQDSYIPGSAPAITLSAQTNILNESTLPEDSLDATIRVKVIDDVSPAVASDGVKLYYRTTGAPTYRVLTMNRNGEYYEATIPVVKRYGIDYYVTATDGQQTSSLPSIDPGMTPFNIAVLPNVAPAITHTPLTTAILNTQLTVQADVLDTTNRVTSVELNYRTVGELSYTTLPMNTLTSDTYEATIPASDVTEDIEYYLYAKDDYGVAAFKGTKDVPFVVAVGGDASAPILQYVAGDTYTDDIVADGRGVHPNKGVAQKDELTFKVLYKDIDGTPHDTVRLHTRHDKDFSTDFHVKELVPTEQVYTQIFWKDLSDIYPDQTGRVFGMDTGLFNKSGFDGNESLEMSLPGNGKTNVTLGVTVSGHGNAPGYPRASMRLDALAEDGTVLDSDELAVVLVNGETPEDNLLMVQNAEGLIDSVRFSVRDTEESETWIRSLSVDEELPMVREHTTSVDYKNGEIFTIAALFSKGEYSYYFTATDTDNLTNRLPKSGSLSFTTGYSSVAFVPGHQGSRLYRPGLTPWTEDQLWYPNASNDIRDLALSSTTGASLDPNIYTRDVLDEVAGTLNIYKSFLSNMNGLVENGSIAEFEPLPYDWRKDQKDVVLDTVATDSEGKGYLLTQKIKNLASTSDSGKVTIITHSNGGLVAKELIERLRVSDDTKLVEQLVMVAAPELGTPQAALSLLHGDNLTGPPDRVNTRELGENMKSAYTLLPSREYFESLRIKTPPNQHVIEFATTTTVTQYYRDLYGDSISDYDAFRAFLLGDNGVRTEPLAGAVNEPNVLKDRFMLNAEKRHDFQDMWTPPPGIEVVEIIGWGLDTLSGIQYGATQKTVCREDLSVCLKQAVIDPRPLITGKGDGTVVAMSAGVTAGAKRYWVEVDKYNEKRNTVNRDHKNILEVTPLLTLLSMLVQNQSTNTLPDTILASQPTTLVDDVRWRIGVHSPVTLHLYDTQGRHTGPTTNPDPESDLPFVEEQIPNTYYWRIGEGQYAGIDARESAVRLVGDQLGTFTITIDEIVGDETARTYTFTDIPTTLGTKAVVALEETMREPVLLMDISGDGTYEVRILANKKLSDKDRFTLLKEVAATLTLPKKEQRLLSLAIEHILDFVEKEEKLGIDFAHQITQKTEHLVKVLEKFEKHDVLSPETVLELNYMIEETTL